MEIREIAAIIALFILVLLTFRLYFDAYPSKNYHPVRFMARVGVFGGIATLLYAVPVFKFSLPIFPSFLEIHLDEIPAFIAGFAYGPLSGIAVILVKTIIKLPLSRTMMVGELTDLILSSIYVGVTALIYKKKRNLKGVALGFGLATLIQVVAAMLLNVYVMIPFYAYTMGYGVDALLGMMQKAIPSISDTRWSYAFLAVLPFNLIKDGIVIAITFVVYRYLHVFLRFEGKKKANH